MLFSEDYDLAGSNEDEGEYEGDIRRKHILFARGC